MQTTVDELEAFLAIAEHGGFTEASRRLARSQPAITRRVQQLERALGAALFTRRGRTVDLTDAGRALLPHAEAALAAIRDGARAVREGARTGRGPTLRIAMVGTLADSHLVDALRAFGTKFARAEVELQTATSREVSALVRSGSVALGVRYFPDADPKLDCTPLGAERFGVVVPAAHRIKARRVRDLGAFTGERWLGFAAERRQPESYGRFLERQLTAAGLGDAEVVPIDSLTAQKRLVEAGFGIALMPRSSVREELRLGSLRMIQVATATEGLPVVAVQRRGGYRSRAAAAFVRFLVERTPDLFA
jgi:DNA-binding transcriptional LysR family regulator